MEFPVCRLPVEEPARTAATRRRPATPSLFACRGCGQPTPGKRLPPALAHRRGKVWSTAPEDREGVAVLVHENKVVVTCWTSPFLEGPSLTLTLAELRRFLRDAE